MAEKQKYGVLENVILAYAKIAEPSTKYQSTDLEYSVDCVVDKATAKAWNKQFAKQKAKEFDREDFETKFKMTAPFEGDEIYVIKMKKAATKDGEVFDEKYRPKVFLDTSDGERVEITTSRLISNGSVAKVSYRVTENSYGIFGQLNNILMDEDGFKEYINTSSADGSEFGTSKPVKKEPSRVEATEARKSKEVEKPTKPNKPAKKIIEDDSDDGDSAPF